MKLLPIIFLFCTVLSFGVNTKPKLLRGCVNYDDSTITVSWRNIEDNCGSFTKAKLYANENNGSFILIAIINNLSITEYSHYIPNLNTKRMYYLSVHSACNGTDSLTSDTISPDLTYPANIEIDSVSFDFNTQQIIAGWKANPSNDTRGYQIYNYETGNGDSIGFTSNTNFIVSPGLVNIFPVVLATLDSCDLSSTLSSPHRVMRLSGTLDTCKNTIALNWTKYQGWQQIDSIVLLVQRNHQSFAKEITLPGNTTSFVFNNFQLGDTLDLFVRAYTNAGTISSSSNRLLFKTRKLTEPSQLYLSNVSVVNDDYIAIDLYLDNIDDQETIVLYKLNEEGKAEINSTVDIAEFNNYSVNDPNVVVNERSYAYKAKLVNKCFDTIKESNVSRSILLNTEKGAVFTSYINWAGGVNRYSIESSQDGSTWNETESTNDTFSKSQKLDASCYRVVAYENDNLFSFNKISTSNTSCVSDSMRVYVPTAMNLNTSNNRFIIAGTGIDHEKSSYQIFNRWGEKLVDQSTGSTWNGVYRGETIPSGVYIYIINAIGYKGEKQVFKGTLYVVR